MFWLFWISVAFLAYSFAGYPALLWLLWRLRGREHQRAPITPPVSVIIAVHNGSKILEQKIRNTLRLRYPREMLEIIVASDASSDGSCAIARSFADQGIRLVELAEHRGKHYAQMVAREQARGDIFVFTDAGVTLPEEALENIVANFADPEVGAVSSVDRVEGAGNVPVEHTYVGLEMRLRRMESSVGSLVGVSGSFFAARREVCVRWNPEQSSDFFIALNSVRLGLRVVVDANSYATFGTVSKHSAEFRRKIRTIVHGLDVLFANAALLNPFRYGLFAWQLVSHKLFRWLLPFAFIALLVANFFLWRSGPFYAVTLVAQCGLYGMGLLALAVKQIMQWKPLKLARFFLLGNVATLVAWFNFCSGEKFVTWEPSRRG